MTTEAEKVKNECSHFSTYNSTPEYALALMERARKHCPVPHSDELGGFHILLNYNDVRQGLLDWKNFASGPSVVRPYIEGTPVLPPVSKDPPEHTVWRKIFTDGVNVRTPDLVEPKVRADAIALIEGFAGRGECDLASDLAEPVPINTILHIMGIDNEEHDKIRALTLRLLKSVEDPEAFAGLFAEFGAFGVEQVERRRSDPRDDYLTALSVARIDGRLLTAEEIGAAVISLLGAGHGTTVAALANLFYEVLRRPEVKQRLIADPSLIPAAAEECVRLHNPFFGLFRSATADVTVGDVKIRKGESIYMCWQAANRDPTVIDNPAEFILDRPPFQHLGFGLGKHACIGAPTARMQMRVVLEELLRRLPDIELKEAAAVNWRFHGSETLAIETLPARFTPR